MLAERGVNVDHSTIYRWVQRYAPEMENGCAGTGVTLPIFARGTWMKPRVKVNGRWAYLYRAVDSRGRNTVDFISSVGQQSCRYWFLGKILNNVKKWQIPRFINTG